MSNTKAKSGKSHSQDTGDWGEPTPATIATPETEKPKTSSSTETIQAQIAARTKAGIERNNTALEEVPPQIAIESAIAEIEKRLEPDLKKSFALLREVESTKADTRREVKIKRAMLKRVKQHCFALQQGKPTLPPPTSNQLVSQKRASQSLPQRRRERLQRLKSEKFRPAFPKVDAASNPLKRLLGEPEIQAGVVDYATKWRAYVLAYLEAEDEGLLSPQDRLERLNQQLAGCRELARIKELRAEIAEVSASAIGVRHENDVHATRSVLGSLLTPARESLQALLHASLNFLQGYLTEAIETERAFLAKSGLAWEPTPLSRRVQEAIDRVTRVLNGHKAATVGGAVGVVESNVKSLFGITID